MVGLIPRILVQTVQTLAGEPGLRALSQASQIDLSQNFKMGAPYSDDDWRRLFAGAQIILGLSRSSFIEAFADEFMRDAVNRWPMWFNMVKSSREFLKLQPLIHNSFASGVVDPEARRQVEDKFRLEELGDQVIVHYRSENALCDLYEALAKRVARHYDDEIEIETQACVHRGDPKCQMRIQFVEAKTQAEASP